ncbi:LacI family transcriptional regulator [Flammeovirga sp. MY04]|uniref:LacI family DNA-binding transcriptional regulator n=1 Tax=Flammeovirga sp. MY04 TaxID=1191459 RepID=UPI0008063B5F|nr:LacI family DNA-binding transcriptional regulator [Flammeovirga sp. MY04]ANQ51917.1 LacI family transcriptional regulator [Flammeovirga sp. MY04]
MKKDRVTIKDIAKALNVSVTTVSRALNGGERISESTRKKVEELAKKWKYRPNQLAKNLQQNSTKTVGVVIPEYNHNFFSMMLHGIEDRARELNYQLIIKSSGRSYEQEKENCFNLSDLKVDGLLIALSQDREDYSYLNDIYDEGIPIILLDRICEDIDTSVVITDDFDGAFKAVDYLIKNGHQHIVHLKGEEGISTTFNRYMGYVEALKDSQLPFHSDMVISTEVQNDWENALRKILNDEHRPTALFAVTDYIAFQAMEICKQEGLEIPKDISIIGYADEPVSIYTSPKLTTVKQPSYDMGKKAIEILFNTSDDLKSEHIVLETELMVRDSTATT